MIQVWHLKVYCTGYSAGGEVIQSTEELIYYTQSRMFAFRSKLFLGFSKPWYVQVAVPVHSIGRGHIYVHDEKCMISMIGNAPIYLKTNFMQKYKHGSIAESLQSIQSRVRSLIVQSRIRTWLAVLMGNHQRLGGSSLLNLLDDDLLRFILVL